jgi:hypothetical protein
MPDEGVTTKDGAFALSATAPIGTIVAVTISTNPKTLLHIMSHFVVPEPVTIT